MSRDRLSTGAGDSPVDVRGVAYDQDIAVDEINQVNSTDVIALDIEMPPMNDLTLTRRWRLHRVASKVRSGFVRLHRHFSYKTSELADVSGCVERQHLVMLALGFLLLISCVIISIWLIDMNNETKNNEEEGPVLTAAIATSAPFAVINRFKGEGV